MDTVGLSPEQKRQLQRVLNSGSGMTMEQALGQGYDVLNIGLNRPATLMQRSLKNTVTGLPGFLGGANEGGRGVLARMAGSAPLKIGLKAGTGLGALGGVLGAADILTGNDSFANKAMDATAMGIGGILGSVGGPVGTAAGAGVGKAISDGAQFLLGGGKSAEQRRLEEALRALNGGQY